MTVAEFKEIMTKEERQKKREKQAKKIMELEGMFYAPKVPPEKLSVKFGKGLDKVAKEINSFGDMMQDVSVEVEKFSKEMEKMSPSEPMFDYDERPRRKARKKKARR